MYNDKINHSCGAIVMGCGPSLADVEMRLISERVTISFNRSYVAYEQWGFEPTYYACIDRNSLLDNAAEIQDLIFKSRIKRFFLRDTAKAFGFYPSDRVELIHVTEKPLFSTDLTCLGMFHNVAAVSIQILAALGFRRFVLVGVDGHYVNQPNVRELETRYDLQAMMDNDTNHFCPNYHGAGRRFTRTNRAKIMLGWNALATSIQGTEIEVVNASTRTVVDCFPRMSLDRALEWLEAAA